MRDREEIETAMLEARTDLEDSTRALVHRVREKTAIRARLGHAVRAHAGAIALIAGGLLLLFAFGRIRRALEHVSKTP